MPEQPNNVPNQVTDAAQQVEPDDVREAIETARGEELKDGDLREQIESEQEGSAVRASFEDAERTEEERKTRPS